MKKKLNIKSLILEIAVAVVFSGATVFFGWMFVNEYFSALDSTETEEIGFFARTRGIIQLRRSGGVQWRTVDSTATVLVRRRDVIRTTENSGATIKLESRDDSGLKGTLELGPNTYIILESNGDDQGIKFVSGSLITSKLEGVNISTKNATVSSDTGSVILSGDENEETKVFSPDGTVVVSQDGKSVNVSAGTEIHIDENIGDIQQSETSIILNSPSDNEEIFTEDSVASVIFEWNLLANWNNVSVELSSNPNFSESSSLEVEDTSQIRSSLNLGEWYWRVKNTDTGETSKIQTFSLVQVQPVIPIYPSANLSIVYRGENPKVFFQWEQSSLTFNYNFQVSRDEQFQNLIVDKIVEGNSLQVDTLSEGEWWWRIAPIYLSSTLSEASRSNKQRFSLKFKVDYSQIALVIPNNDVEISALDAQKKGVPFRWEKEEGIASYNVRVSSTPDMENILAYETTKNSYIKIPNIKDSGRYYWQVLALSSDNTPVPPSEIWSFLITPITEEIEMISPAFGEVLDFQSYQPYTFAWRTNLENFAEFDLKRVIDGVEYDVVKSFVDSNTFNVAIPGDGFYVWKITSLDKDGNFVMDSGRSRFQVLTKVNPPELLVPKPDENLILVESQPMTVTWTAVENAEAYRLSLFDSDNTFIARDVRVTGESVGLPLPSKLNLGLYTLQLSSERGSSIGGELISSEPANYQFRVSGFSSVGAAVPSSPANGSNFAEERVIQDGIRFRWTQNSSLDQWIIELNNGNSARIYRTNRQELLLKNLSPGEYSWIVRGQDSLGRDVPKSTQSRFTIRAIPTPKTPTMIFPRSRQNINMTNAKSLEFKWNAVENADYYELEIYKKNEKNPLFRNLKINEPQYVLKNLQLLDVGDFILKLRAQSEYSNINVTRASDFINVPFSLSIKISKKEPEILTNELQYVR